MKIDIHITDATPEEAAVIFCGISVQEAAKAVVKKIVQKKAIPDPTPDNDPCMKCDHDIRDIAGCEKCSPPPSRSAATLKAKYNPPAVERKVKKPKGHAIKGSRYKRKDDKQIPFHSITDKAKYQAALKLCKKYDLPYPEAVKACGRGDPIKNIPKKPERHPKETPLAIRLRGPTEAQSKIKDLILTKNGPLHAGQRVRHNGSKGSPLFGKEGEILKVASDGQVFVKFGESSTWLMPHSVAVLPGVQG